ncbi:MAG: mannosyltransferase family protein [Thermomicrobiales bacterium]
MAYGTRGRARGNAHQDTVRLTGVRATGAARGRRTWLERVADGAISFPVVVGIIHLVIVQFAASLAFRYGTSFRTSAPYNSECAGNPDLPACGLEAPLGGLTQEIVGPFRLWDGLWYKLIAQEGYSFRDALAAFWPLYPWSMRGVHDLFGISYDLAGYLISNVSFVVALVLLYQLISVDFDEVIAKRTLWAIALFPTSFFFSAVYTESLFLMLAVGALLAARRGNWWVAGIMGLLAALTRSYGVLLLVPFAILFLQQYRFNVPRWLPNAIPAALPAIGPIIFGWRLASLDREWADFWLFKDVQEQWARRSAMPWETLSWAFSNSPHGEELGVRAGADWSWVGNLFGNLGWDTLTSGVFREQVGNSDTLELVATLLFLALAVIGLKMLPLYQSAFLIPGLVIPLFQPSGVHVLMSMPRFGLTLFPLFVVMALLLRQRRIALPVAAVSTVLLILLTMQFANWYWVS